GVYKTTDGGQHWQRVLGDKEWTGATDLLIDPRDPQVLYAATWQRHRTVAAYLGGGPGTGIYRSTDGGDSWEKLTTGLPTGPLGKIGLAISPQDPDVVYAAIEEQRRTGALYRSADRGASWEKRASVVSGGTGPHYYQELYASPHQFDRLYLMDVRIQVSDDGGQTFRRLQEQHKHSDNHALAFRADDPDYLLVGTDGGLYESFDLASNWRYFANLPVTQFYKIALDDSEPFYNIYGGTQDNSTQGGPSRTDNAQGIQNSDWRVVLDWDGHQPATEPGNPDIVYAERQEGTLSRLDMTTGEVVDIQPQPREGEDYERFNWDAPILVSPHQPSRIYFASQRVWRSDNRGDSWTTISGDLTRDQERLDLPIMGRRQSWDNAWDVLAMSNYNTITSLAESPVQEGLIYAGTDDGLIQVTEDGGGNWRRIEVGRLPGVPATAFVNDIKADLFDANTVYVVLDNHKYGDYMPYLCKSTDAGRTWTSLRANLPERTLLWRIVQDHEKPGLLFLASEFGVYFTVNGGGQWTELTGKMPTISFRDLAIQRRENDLVAASFGRGIFILDDYTPLRSVTTEQLAAEATLFPPRKAWWYIPRSHLNFDSGRGDQGAGHYVAPNPPFGAVFTYYLKEGMTTPKAERQEMEKERADQDIPFPGWDVLAEEAAAAEPRIWLVVSNTAGEVVRRISGPVSAGLHRVSWDLYYPAPFALSGEVDEDDHGLLAAPGTYSVALYREQNGQVTQLGEAQSFQVEPLRQGALPGSTPAETAAFWRQFEQVYADFSSLNIGFSQAGEHLTLLQTALQRTPLPPGAMDTELYTLRETMMNLQEAMNGNPAKLEIGEKVAPTIGERLFAVSRIVGGSTYGPTATARETLRLAEEQINALSQQLTDWHQRAVAIARRLQEAGGPRVEGLE
ncbi:MAG: glycosyl hydrolase, partial [Lewinella sp.]|nr:glycosyl hydrolase [Lewinella sp.]